MAKQRVVNTRFWDDEYVMDLTPFEKLLFLYFLTNPLTDLCGAYEVSLKRIAFDTGLKPVKIEEILNTFESGGKILYRKGWVFIKNFGKHQQGNSPNVKKGAERSLSACPDWVKQTLSKGWDSIGIENALLPELIPEPELEPLEKEAVAEAAPPTPTEARFGDSHFDNPPVALFEELFHFKTGSNFAKEIFRRVKNFQVWEKLLRDKITYADKSMDERRKLTNWILTEYDKRIQESKNGKPNQSYQDRRAELAQQSYEREAAIRERVRERDRAVSGKALSDSRGQLQLVESNANGQRESGENGSVGTGTDGRDTRG